MRKNQIKKILCGVAALALACPTVPAFAWGPERPTYTNNDPADHAVFNSITDNVAVGDERDFVRIAEAGNGQPYNSKLELQANKEYEVYFYYHNDASGTFNDKAYNYKGVAREVIAATSFPSTLQKGEEGQVSGAIVWKNFDLSKGNPGEVWDEAWVTASEKLTLQYVPGTAKIYNSWGVNGTVLPDEFFSTGTYLGLDELDGIILGCAEYSGHIVYRIKTIGEETPPPTPPDNPPDTPVNPDTPSEIPSTGPVEMIVAVVIVLAIFGGGFYWLATRKHLQKATRAAAASRKKTSPARKITTRRKATTTRRTPVKRTAVKRAQRKRAVKKVVRNKRK